MHARQQIREKVRELLVNATDAGESVFSSFTRVEDDLPVLFVHTSAEESDEQRASSGGLMRQLTIEIEAYDERRENLSDALDTLAVQIEKTLLKDHTLGGLVKLLQYRSMDLDYDTQGEVPVGVETFSYNALYRTAYADPETIIQ